MALPTFETLEDFPVFIKVKIEQDLPILIKIHSTAVMEMLSVCNEEDYKLYTYGINGLKSIESINDLLLDPTCLYIDEERWNEALSQLKESLASEV